MPVRQSRILRLTACLTIYEKNLWTDIAACPRFVEPLLRRQRNTLIWTIGSSGDRSERDYTIIQERQCYRPNGARRMQIVVRADSVFSIPSLDTPVPMHISLLTVSFIHRDIACKTFDDCRS